MDAKHVGDMLHRDRAEFAALQAVLHQFPNGNLHAEGPAWEARDIYTHLARWMHHSMDQFETVRDGGQAAARPGSDDEINARWQAEDAHMGFAEAQAFCRRAFDRREALIRELPVDRWTLELEAIAAADGADHIAAHRKALVVRR